MSFGWRKAFDVASRQAISKSLKELSTLGFVRGKIKRMDYLPIRLATGNLNHRSRLAIATFRDGTKTVIVAIASAYDRLAPWTSIGAEIFYAPTSLIKTEKKKIKLRNVLRDPVVVWAPDFLDQAPLLDQWGGDFSERIRKAAWEILKS